MSRRYVWATVWALLLLGGASTGSVATAQEIGFRETYALAEDRAAVLKRLVPGTEDYYYYHCLYYQQTQQFPRVDTLLAEWEKKRGRTALWKVIRNRQALLTYADHPAETIEYLRRELGLAFADHGWTSNGSTPRFPSRLDPSLIDRDTIARNLLKNPRTLSGFNETAHYWLATWKLTPYQRHAFLAQLKRPDVPGLVAMIDEDLRSRMTAGFGQLDIHKRLTRQQMDELAKRNPTVLSQAPFVQEYLKRLVPSADERPDSDETQKRHLDRLWKFAQTLPPVHNSLKAHVLYHRLKFDLEHGTFDKALFIAYLKLPRRSPHVNPQFLRQPEASRYAANLGAKFDEFTLRPPIGDDRSLIQAYLEHFFQKETTFDEYLPYLKDSFVRRVFAETKVLYGLGDPQEWTKYLSPAEYTEISERVELRFAPTNRKQFGVSDPVSLELDVKNVPTLLVKVYRINTWNYYRMHKKHVPTDIDLEGLVPTWEQRHIYQEPPQRRVRRRFDFPQLKEPGVYVIDFVGNGKQSRVVVRKGQLEYIAKTTPAGVRITVLGEDGKPLPKATVWLAGQLYHPDERGSVVVPFSDGDKAEPMILSHHGFHDLAQHQPVSEQYYLDACFLVNRESLIAGKEATVAVRSRLLLAGRPVSLSLLHDVRLVVTFTQLGSITTTAEVHPFELYEDRESTYRFRVPPRAQEIRFSLTAKVRQLTTGKDVDVKSYDFVEFNAIDESLEVAQLLLAFQGGQYELRALGRNGEPLPGTVVRLSLHHRDFEKPVRVTLQTDENGVIHLGPLKAIVELEAQLESATPSTEDDDEYSTYSWWLERENHSRETTIHARAGETIEIPVSSSQARLDRAEWSLLALRGETIVADLFDKLALADGMITIQGLEPGLYALASHWTKEVIVILVTKGDVVDGHVVGPTRILQLRRDKPLQIAELQVTDQVVRARLVHASPFTRVHVLANQFVLHRSPFWEMNQRIPGGSGHSRSWRANLYLPERRVSDEYRYILQRRHARKFPGNMLARPSLLLDPWSPRTTDQIERKLSEGEKLENLDLTLSMSEDAVEGPIGYGETFPPYIANLDFLHEPGRVWLNLKPNDDGWVEIDRKELRHHPHLTWIAIDPNDTVLREVSLPKADAPHVDLRLAKSLDVDRHFIQSKKVLAVPKGEKLTIADYRSARVKIYDDVSKLMSLYLAFLESNSSEQDILRKFEFLTRWHALEDRQKEDLYNRYACHELNVFLYFKDRAFFDRVVRPHLVNKSPQRLVDQWLLQKPLKQPIGIYSLERLNAFERALVARRTGRTEFIRLDVDPMLQVSERESGRTWFEMALYGGTATLATLWNEGRPFVTSIEPVIRDEPADGKGGEAASKDKAAGRDSLRRHEEKARKKSAAPRPGSPPESRQYLKRQGKVANGYFDADARARRRAGRQLYRYQPVEKTRAWVESHYYHRRLAEIRPELVPWGKFWVDFALGRDDHPILSTHVAEAHRTATETLLALAVVDLPFRAGKHEMKLTDDVMVITAASPLIAFHEQIEPVEPGEVNAAVLVSQVYFDPQAASSDEGILRDTEMLVRRPYGCRVVLSNPSSRKRIVDVLVQIPAGAMPLNGGRATESHHAVLEPYATQSIEYFFYFPEQGDFDHFPAHVSEEGILTAFASPQELHVVHQRSRLDKSSWVDVAKNGSTEEVIDYLKNHSLLRTDLKLITPRMRDRRFYDAVMGLLEERSYYDHGLAAYALLHQDRPPRIRRFLEHADAFVNQCGMALSSPLLDLDPIERGRYEHVEFRPLVNARAHPIGPKREILNVGLLKQYQAFLDWLCELPEVSDAHRLELVYYLLLQDRIAEALHHFAAIDREKIERRMQYDYCSAYLRFFGPDPEPARAIAEQYADYPVPRWRNAFHEILAQLDEIETGRTQLVDAEDRDQRVAAAAASRPVLELAVEGDRVLIHHRNVKRAQLNFYPMDIELLFSRSPFVQQFGRQFGQVYPHVQIDVELKDEKKGEVIELPKELKSQHLLVEAVGDGVTATRVRFASRLHVELVESHGMLRVVDRESGRPLPQVYVKVFAKLRGGDVGFYKDGYTDLRGRFDYATLSSDKLASVERFALLVLSDEKGAEIREVEPPKP